MEEEEKRDVLVRVENVFQVFLCVLRKQTDKVGEKKWQYKFSIELQ